jgi:hypothetical protein
MKNITEQRIFFGHQSVGANILDGLRDLLADSERPEIIEARTPDTCQSPCFIHSRIGENGDPQSKIDDFVSLMDSGFGNNVDIAGFKFCYIDIQESTKVQRLFDTYRDALLMLENKYKDTMFLHITVPIRTAELGLRRIAKNLLGKPSMAAAKNLNRQNFNELMHQQFGNTGRIFDLAGIEATYPNGSRCRSRYNGIDVDSLVPQFTDDGGHLNPRGRRVVGAKFLDALNRLSATSPRTIKKRATG